MPPDDQLEKAKALERRQHFDAVSKLRPELEREIAGLRASQAAKGLAQSGATIRQEARLWNEYLEKRLERRIADRRQLGSRFPLLLSDNELEELRDELHNDVDNAERARRDAAGRQGNAAATVGHTGPLLDVARLRAQVTAGIEKLQLQRDLDMIKDPFASSPGSIVIRDLHGVLNINSVVQSVQNKVTILHESGAQQIAAALKDAQDEIQRNTALTDAMRVEYLQAVESLAEQAKLPKGERNGFNVKTAVGALVKLIGALGSVATIAQYFGVTIA
jgi:hypothetical protein